MSSPGWVFSDLETYYMFRSGISKARINACSITIETGTLTGTIYLTDFITFLVILTSELERLILQIGSLVLPERYNRKENRLPLPCTVPRKIKQTLADFEYADRFLKIIRIAAQLLNNLV